MEWLLGLIAAGGAVGVVGRVRRRRFDRKRAEIELEAVRGLVEEDVTVLAEELERLAPGVHVELEGEGLRDYQAAIDALDSARGALARLDTTDQVGAVVESLSEGRYALACLYARVEGRPLPERRTPCFFNPQHGPSTTDVLWTQPGRGTRTVPACAMDADRKAAGEQPAVRLVTLGGRRLPYWEAGEVVESYTRGFFAGTVLDAGVIEARRDHKSFVATFASWPGTKFNGGFERRDPS